MFSHITVGSNNVSKAVEFYENVLSPLGYQKTVEDLEVGYCGFRKGEESSGAFWVVKPYNNEPATFGNGVTIGFLAENRETVDAFYTAAMKAGGTDEGAPGLRPHYHPDCYACYVRDPEGNKLCCICHKPYPVL